MTDPIRLIMAGVVGLALGGAFFGGLRWTISRGLASGQPALWFGASIIVRMGLAMAGFYWVGQGDWRRLLACLVGFSVARLVVLWATRHQGSRPCI